MNLLEVSGLTKTYGTNHAVNAIDFHIAGGEIFGLIGPNGAGKTTTLRIISTLLSKSSGEVKVCGHDVQTDPHEVRRSISYLPEEAGVYKNLKGREYLEFIAGFHAEKKERPAMVERGMSIANLGARINDKVSTYSKGMTRRLTIARALMMNPKLAILDEPTSGLDVINAHEVRNIIKKSISERSAVLLSSHNMLEVDYLCDRIALISGGVIVETGTPDSLKEKYQCSNIEEIFMKIVETLSHADEPDKKRD
ncbi:ABC transporter ATP-binding protein [Myxococcota bacterium]|nr:ABC transporter ATP-binding protein [Myxococcota bacterium]MBU1533957.1 ABC transporter ATP-binding protein [Myxococcota bacterium]